MPENCLIIPIHVPGGMWLNSFFASIPAITEADSRDFSIILATSNAGEAHHFRHIVDLTKKDRPLNIDIQVLDIDGYVGANFPSLIRNYRLRHMQCTINVKKFVALHWAMGRGFEWAACIDADSLAVSDMKGLFSDLRRNYDRGLYFGAPTDDDLMRTIISQCLEYFPESDKARLIEITNGGTVYPWFFDVPTYKISDIAEFFAFMGRAHGSEETWLTRLNWFSFDHMLFMKWRWLRDGKLIDYSCMGLGGIPEELRACDLDAIREAHDYQPVWARNNLPGSMPYLHLRYHADRA